MFITAGTQLREIGYDYDAQGRPLQIREKRNDPAQNSLQHILSDYVYSPARVVFTTTSEILSPFQNFTTDRLTIDSLNGRMSFSLAEIWDGTQWKGVQKDTFIYNAAGSLLEMNSQSWDFVNSVWKYQFFLKNEYDAQEHLVVQRNLSLDNISGDTSVYSEYIYAYNAAGLKTSRTWKNWNSGTIQNIHREIYSYDANGLLDTLKNDYWIPPINDWSTDNLVVLDNSPEQQITQIGKEYRLNAQFQWYLAKETTYMPGPQIYTDQPSQALTKIFNLGTNQLENNYRELTTYTDLPDGTIKGDYQQAYFENGNWDTGFHVEAWQIKIGSVDAKEPEHLTIPACGLPNPLTVSEAIALPEIATVEGNARIEIYTADGRLAFSQNGLNAADYVKASIPPGIYLVVMRNEKGIICTRKVMASF